MSDVHTEITIAFPPSEVWRVLFDMEAYPEWNPLVTAVKCVPEQGRMIHIRLKVKALPALVVPVIVETLLPETRLCWTFTLPFRLFRAEHCFSLFPVSGGSTRFLNEERFTGLLGGFAGVLINRFFRNDYEGMNNALAVRLLKMPHK